MTFFKHFVAVGKKEKNLMTSRNGISPSIISLHSLNVLSQKNYAQKYNIRLYSSLTHVDDSGKAAMVDVGSKDPSSRTAKARGYIHIGPLISKLIMENNINKGDVLTIAQLAGIMAAKKTSELIPLCHPLMINCVKVDLKLSNTMHRVDIMAEVKVTGKTGVEMEALTAVSVAALTVYDMCKSAAPSDTMYISGIELVSKVGVPGVIFIENNFLTNIPILSSV